MDSPTGLRCDWRVHSCSSEAEVHEASNALKDELYRVWQTAEPAEEAWLVLEAHPPAAFCEMQIVNAGSALVELFGLRDEEACPDEDDGYQMLLSTQQLMSAKDLLNKSNRNRSFTYSTSDKLSQLAAQHRWKQIRVSCRQPFGTEEQKTCIGLSRLSFKLCKTSAEVAAEAAEAHLQENLKTGLAKMFPKGTSDNGCKIYSQVTEPSRLIPTLKVKQEVVPRTIGGHAESPLIACGKRRLPTWQSPSKQVKKKDGGKEVDAGREVISSEEGDGIVDTDMGYSSEPKGGGPRPVVSVERSAEGSQKKNMAPKANRSEGKEPVTPIRKWEKKSTTELLTPSSDPGSNQDNEASKSAQAKGLSTRGKKTLEPCKGNGSQRPCSHQSSKDAQSRHTSINPQTPDHHHSSRDTHLDSQVIRGSEKKHERQPKSPPSESIGRPSQGDMGMHESRRTNQTAPSFSKFLDGVVFAISGLVNPERADIREKALQMGGQYRPDWCSDCTLLVCAFANTPKYNQVKNDNGTIVSKDWILECHQQKKLVEIDKYLMHAGKPWRQVGASITDEPDDDAPDQSSLLSSLRSCKSKTTTLASLSQVQQWVCEDLSSSITWLQQQENKPEAEELKSVAIQGIQLCLDDTIECLKNKQSIKNILESWDFVPRAVRELAGREERAENARKPSNGPDMLCEAERLKWVYLTELEKLTNTEELTSHFAGEQGKQAHVDEEVDDATDVMSNDMSSDMLDLESDGTEVLEEDDIKEAEETISKMLAG